MMVAIVINVPATTDAAALLDAVASAVRCCGGRGNVVCMRYCGRSFCIA